MAERHGIQGIFFVVASDPDELRRIADLAEEGELRPVIARTLPLADASIASGHDSVRNGVPDLGRLLLSASHRLAGYPAGGDGLTGLGATIHMRKELAR
jgi:hypothetical protein